MVTSVKLSLSNTQILASGSTPVPAIPAPGVGKAIVIVAAVYKYTFGTVDYNTNSTMGLFYTSASPSQDVPQARAADQCAAATISGVSCPPIQAYGGSAEQLSLGFSPFGGPSPITIDNQPIMFASVDPVTGGDGTMTIAISYIIVPTS